MAPICSHGAGGENVGIRAVGGYMDRSIDWGCWEKWIIYDTTGLVL